MPKKTLNMNKFFGNLYSSISGIKTTNSESISPVSVKPVTPITGDIEKILTPLKQDIESVRTENKQQTNSIIRVTDSIGNLLSSSQLLKSTTENFIKLIEDDARQRQNIEKSEESFYQKVIQKRRAEKKSPSEGKRKRNELVASLGLTGGLVAAVAGAGLLGGGEKPSNPPSNDGGGGGGGTSSELFELIAGGEGGYNSVNRGNAGDTPDGAKSIFGKNLTDMTVGEIMQAQSSGTVFAVGKYQIIPGTMQGFVRKMNISPQDKFNPATQEKFKDYVLKYARPLVGQYIEGKSNDLLGAAQELAREFASVGVSKPENGKRVGESYYGNVGNNKASISPQQIQEALKRARAKTSGTQNNSTNVNNTQAASTISSNNSLSGNSTVASASNNEGGQMMKDVSGSERISIAQAIQAGAGMSDGNESTISTMPSTRMSLEPPSSINKTNQQIMPSMMPFKSPIDVASSASPQNLSSPAAIIDPRNTQSALNRVFRGIEIA